MVKNGRNWHSDSKQDQERSRVKYFWSNKYYLVVVADTNAWKGEEYTPCATCISNIWVCKIMQTYIDYIVRMFIRGLLQDVVWLWWTMNAGLWTIETSGTWTNRCSTFKSEKQIHVGFHPTILRFQRWWKNFAKLQWYRRSLLGYPETETDALSRFARFCLRLLSSPTRFTTCGIAQPNG